MTKDKKFKRAVRKHMLATGESYTRARQLLLADDSATTMSHAQGAGKPEAASGRDGPTRMEASTMGSDIESKKWYQQPPDEAGFSAQPPEETFRVWLQDHEVLSVRANMYEYVTDQQSSRVVFYADRRIVASFRADLVARIEMDGRVKQVADEG